MFFFYEKFGYNNNKVLCISIQISSHLCEIEKCVANMLNRSELVRLFVYIEILVVEVIVMNNLHK